MGEGGGLSFLSGGIKAIVVIVILIVVYAKFPGIANAGSETVDRNLEAAGINIIDIPKILSLTPSVGPDGSVAVKWKLNRDADKIEDRYFKAVFSYKRYPDSLIDDVCTIEHIDKSTQKPGWACSIDNGKRTAVLRNLGNPAGAYKVDVSFEKKEGYITRKGMMGTGMFYAESYVEFLDKPIAGCVDGFWNCNVIECKKKVINTNLLNSFGSPSKVRRESGVLRSISNEFRAEKGFSSSNDCGKVGNLVGKAVDNDKEMSALHLLTAGCSDKDVDDLNIKVARARLLEVAFDDSGQSINSEDKYVTNLARLDFWREQALKMTMSCTMGWTPAPKGASPALQSLGWQLVSPSGKTDVWKGRVNAELDSVLNSKLRPVIIDSTSGTNSDRQLALVWKLPIGKDALTQYRLKLFYSSAAVKETLSDMRKLDGDKKLKLFEIALPKQPAKGEVSFRYPEIGGLASAQMGAYWFELSAFDSKGESDKDEAVAGIYDNKFIETYRDLKDVGDACGSGCDVAGKKESALGNDKLGWSKPSGSSKTYTELAFEKFRDQFHTSCSLKPNLKGEARISGCTGEEVDMMYANVVAEYAKTLPKNSYPPGVTAADWLLKFDCGTDTMKYYERHRKNGIYHVCEAKLKLREELEKSKWIFVS